MSLIDVHWRCSYDEHGRQSFTLQFSDWTGQTETNISPEQLRDKNATRSRLLDVWGDRLQTRSNRQQRKLEELINQED